jgi:hypothetical protein
MPISSAVPKLVALVLAAVALSLGLTKYTAPIHGGPAYATLRDLFGRALGDSRPTLPGPPTTLQLNPAPVPPGPTPELGERIATPPGPLGEFDTSQPQRWATLMAARDSAALRAWLGIAVLPMAVVHGDTVETTLLRLTLRRGCPILSRLKATSVGQLSRNLQLVAVTADCPQLAPAGADPTQGS